MTYGMLWSSTLWPVYMPQGKHLNQPLSVVSCAVIHWFIYGLWYAVIFHSLTSTCATRQTSSQPASLYSELCSHSLIQFMTYSMLWSSTLWPVYMPQGKHLLNQPLSVVSCAVIHWFSLWPMVCQFDPTTTWSGYMPQSKHFHHQSLSVMSSATIHLMTWSMVWSVHMPQGKHLLCQLFSVLSSANIWDSFSQPREWSNLQLNTANIFTTQPLSAVSSAIIQDPISWLRA